jgi:hypothetical protein
VDRLDRPEAERLLEAHAGVLEPAPVRVGDGPPGVRRPDDLRQRLDEEAEAPVVGADFRRRLPGLDRGLGHATSGPRIAGLSSGPVAFVTSAPLKAAAAQCFEQLADRHPVRDFAMRRDGSTLLVLAEEGPALGPPEALLERAGAASRAPGVERVRVEILRTRLRALAHLTEVPSLAYRTLELRTGARPTPKSAVEAGPRHLRNGRLELRVEDDGTLSVAVARAGRTYHGLHRLEDVADAGDEYTHQGLGDPPVTSLGRLVACEVAEAHALRAALRLTWALPVPTRLAPDRHARSCETAELEVKTVVSLEAGAEALEFETTFDNAAEDHRLQVAFPDPEPADEVWAGSAFYLAPRPVGPPSAEGWSEPPADAHPFSGVVASQGLVLASRDLSEYSVRRAGGGLELALTLVRAVGSLARGDLTARPGLAGPPYPTPEAQCRGPQQASYRWAPLPERTPAAVLGAAHRELVVLQAHRGAGPAPLERRLLTVEPGWWATALKPAERGDAAVARLVRIEPGAVLPEAAALDLDEARPRPDDGAVWGIFTLLDRPGATEPGVPLLR